MAKTSSIFSIGDEEAVEALEEDFFLDFDDGACKIQAPQGERDDFSKQQIKKFDQHSKSDVKFKFKTNSAANTLLKPRTEPNIAAKNGSLPQPHLTSKLRVAGGEKKLDLGSALAASSQFKSPLSKVNNFPINRKNYLSSLSNLCNKNAEALSTQNGNQSSSGGQNAGLQRSDLKSPSKKTPPTHLNSRTAKPQVGQERSCTMPKESGLSSVREVRVLSSNQFHPAVTDPQGSANGFQKYQPPNCNSRLQMQGSDKLQASASAAFESENHRDSPVKSGNETGLPDGTVTNNPYKLHSSKHVVQKKVPSAEGTNHEQSVLSSNSMPVPVGGQFKRSNQFVTNKNATAASVVKDGNFKTGRSMSPAKETDAKRDNACIAEGLPGKLPTNHKESLASSSGNPGLRAIPNLQQKVSSVGQFQKRTSVEPLTPEPLISNSHQRSSTFIPAVRPSTPNNNLPFSQFQKRNSSDMNRYHTPPYQSGVPHWNSPGPPRGTSYHGQRYNGSTRMRTPQGPSGDQFPSPQAPVLTPRVAQLCKTPTGPTSSRTARSSRKFPGPAGILPKLAPGQNLSNVDLSPPLEEETKRKENEDAALSSQDSSVDDFSQGAWATMKMEMECDEKDPKSILAQHNIAAVLRRASMRQLQKNKVPHICVMIKLITVHTNDAAVTFKDPTGEMQGTLHRQLLEEYQSDLKPGCVLLLKQVGVLSPSLRNHYLNVTHRNVVQIYPSQHPSSQKSPTSQPPRKSSPKSIKVNKDEFQGNAFSPESSEGRENFITERRDQNVEKQGTNSSGFVSRTEAVASFSGDKEQNNVSGHFQKKRTSDEVIDNRTKRQCLEDIGGEERIQKENVSPNKGATHGGLDTSTYVHDIPTEESIAELIDGFEEELFEDF